MTEKSLSEYEILSLRIANLEKKLLEMNLEHKKDLLEMAKANHDFMKSQVKLNEMAHFYSICFERKLKQSVDGFGDLSQVPRCKR